MKNILSILSLLSILALCACGGGSAAGKGNSFPSPTPPPSKLLDVSGGWQLTTISTVPGMPSTTISGNIAQSGTSLAGAMHVQGSNCFDPTASSALTGTVTGNNVSLTLTSVDGQVTTLSGSVATNSLTGTYAIVGGCADGDQGNVNAMQVPSMTGSLSGTLTSATGVVNMDFQLTQYGASSDGSFGITGNGGFTGACFKSGTLVAGSFPTGSFILGTSLTLQIQTDNGIFSFAGTADLSGLVTGTYTVVGGSCDQSGTASLVASPWDY